MAAQIPAEVQRFLADQVDSLEQLEILLLVWRTRKRVWTAKSVSDELRSSPYSARLRLDGLVAMGLLSRIGDGGYAFTTADPGIERLIEQLEVAYRDRRFTVIDLIFGRRRDPLQVFADAFRFGRDDEDDDDG